MRNRRRIFFIKKRFQSRFIILFCLITLIGSVSLGITLYYLINKKLTAMLYLSHIRIRSVGEIIGPLIFNVNILISSIIIVIAFIVVYVVSRRVEMHLKPFKTFSERVAYGDLSAEVPYLHYDLTDELTTHFNSMVGALGGRMELIKAHLASIKSLVKRLNDMNNANRPLDDLKLVYNDLSERVSELQKEIERFKV